MSKKHLNTIKEKNIMKKLLAAILVISMIASLAVVFSFAEDDTTVADDTTAAAEDKTIGADENPGEIPTIGATDADGSASDAGERDPLTISAGEVTAEIGATEVVVPITVSGIDAILGIGSVLVTVKVEGATIKEIAQADLTTGNWEVGALTDSGTVLWADITTGSKAPSVVFANVTVTLPAELKVDDKLDVQVLVDKDPAMYLSLEEQDGDVVAYGAKAVAGSITIVDKPVETESQTLAPVVTDTDVVEPVSETAAATTAAENDGKHAPQTGDAAIIVVAVMIVALGTAVVVKKVSAK